MSFTALDPELVIDPFTVSSFTGVDQRSGVFLDVDGTNSSVLVKTNDTPVIYAENHQAVGINTTNPKAQLDINAANGTCLQLTYNGSETNKANVNVSSDGKMILASGGAEVSVDAGSNLNVKSHNGSTTGLMLNGTLVRATADQVNYTTVTPGTAAASKAVVLDSAKDVSGVRYFTSERLTGELQTAAQPNVESVTILDITGHTGSAGLKLNGTLVSSTADQLNYTNVTPGQASASKALVVDSSRDVSNINSLTATSLTGQIQTAAQPNITSIGTLSALDLAGNLTGLTNLSIATSEASRSLVVNSEVGNCARFYYDADVNTDNYTDLLVNSAGHLILTSSGGNVDISTHDGSTVGLKLGGVLVTASADQINYLQGTTTGSASAGKAIIVDSNRSISNINSLTATSLTGQLQTAAQPNISSVSALDITTHNGSNAGLKLNSVLVTSTAAELNYTKVTPGTAEASKALVLDSSSDVSGINSLSASQLTGQLQTAAQPNVTSVGTLSSIITSGDITVGSTVISETDIAKIDAITNGTAAAGKALVIDTNLDISGINDLSADSLTGTLQTNYQPNVTSVDILDIAFHDGATQGLRLDNELVVATAGQLNYTTSTPGTAAANKALVVDASKDITGINALSASQLTGELQTAAQPNITSVGTLDSLTLAGELTMGAISISETEITRIDNITPGTVTALKAVVPDANKDISSFRNLTATTVSASDLYGTAQTAYQPNITSVSILDVADHNGTTQGLRLGGELLTVTASQLNSVFGGTGGNASFSDVGVTGTLDVTGLTTMTDVDITGTATIENATDSSSTTTGAITTAGGLGVAKSIYVGNNVNIAGSLVMGSSTITSGELALIDGVTPGAAIASKALVVDSSRNINNINSVSSITNTLTSTFQNTFGTSSTVSSHATGGIAYSSTLGLFVSTVTTSSSTNYYTSTDGSTWTLQTNLPSSRIWTDVVWMPNANKFVMVGGAFALYSSNGTSWDEVSLPISNSARLMYTTTFTRAITYNPGSGEFAATIDGISWSRYTNSNPSNGFISIVEMNNELWFGTSMSGNTMTIQTISGTFGNFSAGFAFSFSNTVSGAYAMAYSPTLDTYVVLGGSNTTGDGMVRYRIGNIAGFSGQLSLPVAGLWNYCIWVDEISAFIAVSRDTTAKMVYSNDGITWYSVAGFSGNNTHTIMWSSSQNKLYVANVGLNVGSISATRTVIVPAALTIDSITITESELSPLNAVTPGTVSASKAVVVDANKDISSFRNLTATNLTGQLQTAAQPNITSVGTLTSVTTSGDITVGTTAISETDIAKIDAITNGTAAASKALVLDANLDISGINSLSATDLTGELQTAAQPNITSVGTLTSLTVTGDLECDGNLIVGGTIISESEIVHLDGATPGTAEALKAMITDEENDITGVNHFGATSLTLTTGPFVVGTTTLTETELTRIDSLTNGTAAASKALVLDSNLDITGINSLSATDLTGEIQTAAQPNITSVGTLSSIITSGTVTVGATVISETDIAKIDAITDGTAAANKALVLNGTLDITGINALSASELTGELQTAAQPNITSVGTLSSIITSGTVTVGATVISETDIAKIDAITNGTAAANKALVLNGTLDISGINALSASELTGEIQTAAQPNITSVGTLTSLTVTGDLECDGNLIVGGTIISESEIVHLDGATPGTAEALKAMITDEENDITGVNHFGATTLTLTTGPFVVGTTTLTETELTRIDSLTNGTAAASKALVLDGNLDISGINALSASELTGEIQTAAQPNITSVGTLTSITTSGTVTVGATVISETDIAKIDAITNGTAAASKALVLDSNLDISGINALSASELTGEIQTAAQPNISSVNVLDITEHDGTTQGLRLGGVLLTVTAAQLNSVFGGAGGDAVFTNIEVTGDIDISGHNGVDTGFSLNGVLVTATATELNYVDVVQGTAAASKALVLDSSLDISGINALSASELTGEIQTAVQPNITSVGTLTSIATSGDITVGATVISETDIAKIDAITNGTAAASKALVLDSNKDITDINKIGAAVLAIGTPANSDLKLEVGSSSYVFGSAYAYHNDSNSLGVIEAGNTTPMDISARFDGRVIVTGEVMVTSDKRLKTNIDNLDADFAKLFIQTTTPVRYNWKSGDEVTEYGYIAQDVYKAGFTDIVTITPHPGLEEIIEDDGFVNPKDAKFTVSTGKIIPLLALNQKSMMEELEQKDAKIASLEAMVAALLSRMESVEARLE